MGTSVLGTELLDLILADAKEWFNKEKNNILSVYKDYWARFQTKHPNEKAERTLNPQDGM